MLPLQRCLFKGVQQLAKIKHPRVLSLQHPLEESRFEQSHNRSVDLTGFDSL